MEEVGSITRKLRHQEWARDVSERISSGLSVKEWCRQNNLSVDTYRSRLRTIRCEMLKDYTGVYRQAKVRKGRCGHKVGPGNRRILCTHESRE